MTPIRKHRILGGAPVRASLAILFLVLIGFQPMFTAMASPCGSTAKVEAAAPDAMAGLHVHAAAQDPGDAHHSGGGEASGDMSADTCCKAHCVSAHALPVPEPAELNAAKRSTYARIPARSLPLGEYAASVRPPRTLI